MEQGGQREAVQVQHPSVFAFGLPVSRAARRTPEGAQGADWLSISVPIGWGLEVKPLGTSLNSNGLAPSFPENEKVGLDDLKDPPALGFLNYRTGISPGTSPGPARVKAQERVTCRRGRRGAALGRWAALRPAGVLEVAVRAGRRGRGKGRARRASGGDGSAEGRCEAPARREPWREAAPRRPRQCPGPQQRPRPPPRGPPGRRPRSPRAPDGRALRAKRRRGAAARGRAAREGALGCPSAPTNPASGTSDPEPGSAESAGGQQKEEEAPQASQSRAPRCRPAGCCGGNRSRRAAGTRPRTTKRRRPGEPSARAAPRRRPPGSRLLRGRASCASRGFPVRSRCWCARPPGGRLPDCP
ncbi:uncharacterized protein AAG666_021126 [Megaptera novaeangliae]